MSRLQPAIDESEVPIHATSATLSGNLALPKESSGVVLFAHGSGSGRFSPRNRFVAHELQEAGIGKLLVELLNEHEEAVDQYTGEFRFNIGLLAERLVCATEWLATLPSPTRLPASYFCASAPAR